ncbi:MAG: polysaccharide deacetylase family protein [Clostridia bacterium]|nr:polysaccharide deacetylase family protein [Clostridia bacterium]
MSKFQKGVITLSIDDGRKDAFRLVNEVLNVYNIPATFNIISGYIDVDCVGNKSTMTLDELKEISKNPLVEIAAHGYLHKNDEEDIIKGKDKLYEWLGLKDDTIGFASPGSGMDKDYICENQERLQNLGFSYIRTGFVKEGRNVEEVLAYSDTADVNGIDELYYQFSNMCINSVPILCKTTAKSMKKMVDLAAREKACLTLMFHSVRKKGEYDPEDLWTYDYDKFVEFIKYLSQKRDNGEIEILTTKDAFIKGKEAASL